MLISYFFDIIRIKNLEVMMNKYSVAILLLSTSINMYANKNWIEFDSKQTNNSSHYDTELKMSNPKSSLKSLDTVNTPNNLNKNTNPDKDLLKVIKAFSEVAQNVRSKIK